jgi:hypothetical protein
MANALRSPTAAPAFPLERVSGLVWEARDLFVAYCDRKVHADTYEQYLDLEALADAFVVVFEALDQLNPRLAKL